jgi:hypothetical protein
MVVLWWGYYLNFVLLTVNLLPMFPLDGARLFEAFLRNRVGRTRAALVGAKVGMVVGSVLFVGAMALGETRIMGLGVIGCLVCFGAFRKAEFILTAGSAPRSETDTPAMLSTDDGHPRIFNAGGDQTDLEKVEERELDFVLEKISTAGIGSLSKRERAILGRATRRRRGS